MSLCSLNAGGGVGPLHLFGYLEHPRARISERIDNTEVVQTTQALGNRLAVQTPSANERGMLILEPLKLIRTHKEGKLVVREELNIWCPIDR